jgi:outer membrane protein OmpA-like peptidoglycan-associated protein
MTRPFSILTVTALLAAGCASKGFVREEVEAAEARTAEQIEVVEDQIEANQTRIEEQQEEIEALSQSSREALERAVAAGKLAEGKFLYETVLSDERVRFGVDSSELSAEARIMLDELAADLRQRNQNVFVEIQGHTDSTGSESYNLELGQQRAMATQRYLNMRHGLALNRMSVISYGESAPIQDNETREGRAANRRVVLVVLQ